MGWRGRPACGGGPHDGRQADGSRGSLMSHAIRKYWRDFAAIVGLAVIALVVGGIILAHQRFYLPSWFPLLGSDFVELKAEMTTAQSVTPGQGQVVTIAGVSVGEITNVSLHDGRALVTMNIRH